LAESEKTKWVWLDRLKAVVEILALIIGGLWAVRLYLETDVPSLEKRPSVQGELNWTTKTKNSCLAEYTVTFKNVGKTSINLQRPILSGYWAEPPHLSGHATYVDPAAFRDDKKRLFHDRALTDHEFSQHYPPDVGDTVTMATLVERKPGRVIMFHLVFNEVSENRPFLSRFLESKRNEDLKQWEDYHWDYACGEPLDKGNAPKSQ
jgi:hypothetical protein